MGLSGYGREVKGAPGKLDAKLIDKLGAEDGNKRTGNGLVAIKVFLEGRRKIKAIVQRRLVKQSAIIDEVTDENGFIVTEAMVQAEKAVIRIIGTENTAKVRLRRKSVDRFDFIDGVYICQHGGIVKGRLTAPLYFVIAKNKGLVLPNGPTDGRTELVLAQYMCSRGLQEVDGIELIVPEILVEGPMTFVGADLGDDIDDAADGASKFRGVITVDDAKFLNRCLRRSAALDSRSCGNIVGAIDGDEVVMDVLSGEGKLGDRLNDNVRAAGCGIADGYCR